MTGFSRLRLVARFVAELALFGIAAWAVGWAVPRWASEATWFLLVAATFFITAMLPMPWRRSISGVASGAFVASLVFFGGLDWAVVFFREPKWSELPSALFSWKNLGKASVLYAVAAAGRAMPALASKMWTRRRTSG